MRFFGGSRTAPSAAVSRRQLNDCGQLIVMPVLQIEQWEGRKAQERMEAIIGRYVVFFFCRFTLRCSEAMWYKGRKTFEDQHSNRNPATQRKVYV